MSNVGQKSQELSRVAECLYRNGNGLYVALIRVKGKQIKKSLETTDRALANRRLADFRKDAQRLELNADRAIKFEELSEMWLESRRGDVKASTIRRRKTALKGLESFFRGLPIRSIGFAEIEKWKRKRGAILSDRTHNIELETLNVIFVYAIDRGILLENPARKFKRRKQAQKEAKAMTKEQFNLMVPQLRQIPKAVASGGADMIEFLAYSGLRVGEASEIRRQDVLLEQNKIKITGGEDGPKNRKERRITIYPALRPVLERILARRDDWKPGDYLFEIDSPRKALATACRNAGIPQFTVHSLRHFFASNAIEAGVSFAVLADFLGHQCRGILAAKTYAHLRDDFAEDSASKMTFQAIPEHQATA